MEDNKINEDIQIGDLNSAPLFGGQEGITEITSSTNEQDKNEKKSIEDTNQEQGIYEDDFEITHQEYEVSEEILNSVEETTMKELESESSNTEDVEMEDEIKKDIESISDESSKLGIMDDLEKIEDENEYTMKDFEYDDIEPYISKEPDVIVNKEPRKTRESRRRKIKKKSSWKNMSRRSKVLTVIASCMVGVVIIGCIAFNTVFAGVFKDFSKAAAQKEKFDTSKQFSGEKVEKVEAEEFNWDIIKGDPTYDENVYNILLLGGDNAKTSGTRGNSDTIMIVSIDKNTKKIKVTSIMRDTYVQIPGYRDNKINSAFATGGVPLIKETIEENFKITIDSTVVLNYSTFRVVIDELGGVENVTINEKEAQFINKECRKKKIKSELTEGTHDLNAYQALHFARIRKISSDIYGKDDFGRTARQRFVINQVFKKYKDLSYTELVKLASKVIKEVEVDKNLKKDIFLLIQVVMKFNAEQIEEFRVPMDNYYTFANVPVSGTGKSMSVVKIDDDIEANIDGLHLFIYGTDLYGTNFEEEEEDESDLATSTPTATDSSTSGSEKKRTTYYPSRSKNTN